jgi:hypothetical protein
MLDMITGIIAVTIPKRKLPLAPRRVEKIFERRLKGHVGSRRYPIQVGKLNP